MVISCLVFKKLQSSFPESLYHFIFSPTMSKWSSFSTSLPSFSVVTIFFCHFDRYLGMSHCDFNLHCSNSFLCSYYYLYILCTEMSVHTPCPFSNEIVCSFTIELWGSPICSRWQSFVRHVICKIFFQSLIWLFILFTCFSIDEKILILLESCLSIFPFMDHAFGVVGKRCVASWVVVKIFTLH